jgi:hypothetical protein
MLDRVEAIEEELRMLKRALPPKARFALALERTRARAKGVNSGRIASAAESATRGVRRAASRESNR